MATYYYMQKKAKKKVFPYALISGWITAGNDVTSGGFTIFCVFQIYDFLSKKKYG